MTIGLAEIIALLLGCVAGIGVYTWYQKKISSKASSSIDEMMKKAEEKRQSMRKNAQREVQEMKNDFHKEKKQLRDETRKREQKLLDRERQLDKKHDQLDNKKEQLEKKVSELSEKEKQLEVMVEQQKEEIEKVAKLSQAEAKKLLIEQIETESANEIMEHVRKVEADLKANMMKEAKSMLVESIQRCASEVVSENTVTVVELPSDDMKGRIIGKEGRNIQAFEKFAGVDVIIDDTPGIVMISGFDLMRRYVAKLAMQKLVEDGRIHPTHIEEQVKKSQIEVKEKIKDIGHRVAMQLSLTGFHPELIELLGKLKFRTSHGQNVLKHSVEVYYIASYLAQEIGADLNICQRGALLHAIGKAEDHEADEKYTVIGKNIAKRYGISEPIQHVIEAHTGDVPARTIEASIVGIAKRMSLFRPGAKKDGLEAYVRRLKNIEKIAMECNGVVSAFALQAGKALQVVVNSDVVDDLKAYKLAKDIASRVEKSMDHAGQVKITVTRETHVVEVAK